MHPAVSMVCEVVAMACLAMCTYLSSSGHYLQLLPWSLWITTLDGSLPWSSFFSLLAHSSFVDHCFVHLFFQFSAQPSPTCGWYFLRAPHQTLMAPVPKLINGWWVKVELFFNLIDFRWSLWKLAPFFGQHVPVCPTFIW